MKLLLSCVLLAIPAAAVAQPSKATDVSTMASDDCARARKAGKTCVLTIEDEDIEAGVPTGNGTTVIALDTGKMASLIRIRRDFIKEILKSAAFERPIDDKAVIRELHAVKEALVACHKVADRVGAHVDRIVDEGEKHGLPGDERGSFNPFPQVPDLDADTTNFLIQAKRAIRRISSLPSMPATAVSTQAPSASIRRPRKSR